MILRTYYDNRAEETIDRAKGIRKHLIFIESDVYELQVFIQKLCARQDYLKMLNLNNISAWISRTVSAKLPFWGSFHTFTPLGTR